ncbi:PREDICTED: la-related protein 7 [Ceratosolen solmsi marchali]|uniref:La-related protein 7 n=1 Tax=Ceratosolen solmsi marchali TaxID=326594 RepID=A0AAJ6YJY2_9HYME|nr:PREDICTED: la-related protein 7 [Ceratosolen solmsi marchali]XP_011499442.1 PREDICTED: la-related protein 7 [Ceratosolen solmsi marchali]XP_011499443.1 PREDICTED: la-related protein 7 [Ceratosolen solmsi marchali]
MVSEELNTDIELASEVIPVPQIQPEAKALNVLNATNEESNNIHHGKIRHRKKALHAAILKQMEFYFGDSNLSKDRYLAGLIKKEPNIDLEVFLRFNKIRSLTTDVNRIINALKKSTILKVSEDGTKVFRVTPIAEKQNIDECTVYIQRLPSDADHEWLTTLFSEYGPVAYVSIPKFKYNHKIKGFAFIEFETPEAAEKCLKAFRAKGCELPSQTSPMDVLSITTYTEENKQDENDLHTFRKPNENNYDSKVNGDNVQKDKPLEYEKSKVKRKRKKSMKTDDAGDSGTDQSDTTKSKKRKNTDSDKELNTYLSDSNVEDEKRGKKRKNRLSLEEIHDSGNESHKILKESCKKQKKIKSEETVQIPIQTESITTEDNREIAEYSNEEDLSDKRKNLKESYKKQKKIKTEEIEVKIEHGSLKAEAADTLDNEEPVEYSNGDVSEKKKKKKRKRKHHGAYEVLETADMGLQVMGKRDWKKLRNKYLELQRSKMKQLKQHMRRARRNQWGDRNKIEVEHEESVDSKKEKPASNLEFVPGVIVKVEFNEPCVDVKDFKLELKSNSNIKYIDIKEGAHEAFIRCDSSEATATLVQKSNETKHFTVLTGDEEKSYWDKIVKDREEKIGNKIRVKQRGRNKLLKKAEKELGKHIKFDEV